MNEGDQFEREKSNNIFNLGKNVEAKQAAVEFMLRTADQKYTYNYTWLGRPIIQFPQDMIAMQEILWSLKPDLIIETGVAHGGSIIYYASILELIGHGNIIGIDIDIRKHNRIAIESHQLNKRITLVEGSSISNEIFDQVVSLANGKHSIVVILDSNHTHDHVLQELRMYSSLVHMGNYIVVFDTFIEDMPNNSFPHRPWGKGNNPKTATRQFLKENHRFVVDKHIENKLLITVAPDGYLRCVKD